MRGLSRRLAGRLTRRLQLLLALAVVTTALGAVTASGASFVSTSSTSVQASAAVRGTYVMTASAGVGGQSTVAGTAVATPPAVTIKDQAGNPVEGITVTFSVLSGGGSVTGGSPVTDEDGVAAVGSWILGSTPGANSLQATCTGVTGSPITFTATGTSGPAVKIQAVSVLSQQGVAGADAPTDPSVKVTDAGGNPVNNFNVTFTVASGGGSVNAGSGKTNSSGIATVNSWTLGTAAGVNTLTASASGLTGSPVTFTANGVAGPARKMTMNGGDGQTPHVGTAVTQPPSVLVTDINNNPVAGVSVTFTVAPGSGSITGGSATTNAAGVAAVGSWTVSTVAGTNTLTASSSGLPTVTFTATGITGSPTTMSMVAGSNGLSATVNTAVATAPTVKITDAYNNPVAGQAVAFVVTTGGGTVTTLSTTTNAQGLASAGSWRLGTKAGTNTVTATSLGMANSPMTFTATGVADAASRFVVTAANYSPPVSSVVTITAQVADQYDNPVAAGNVPVTFSKSTTSGTLSSTSGTTGPTGAATVNLTVAQTVGTVYQVTAKSGSMTGTTPNITAIAGTPTEIAVNGGSGQTATVNTAVATAPSAIVKDAYGNPVSGVVVTFSVASGGGTVGGAVEMTATTSASGVATAGSWVLGTKAGANTLTATFAGYVGTPATFTATGIAGPATKYLVTASDYNPVHGTAITMTAQLTDQYGNPVATSNLRVRWTKTGKGGWFTATRTTTNASGVATTTFYVSSTVGRVHTVKATSTNPSTRTGTSAAITTR